MDSIAKTSTLAQGKSPNRNNFDLAIGLEQQNLPTNDASQSQQSRAEQQDLNASVKPEEAEEKWHKYKYPEYDGTYGRAKLIADLRAVITKVAFDFWLAADGCGPVCYATKEELASRTDRSVRQIERGIEVIVGYGLGSHELRAIAGTPRLCWNFDALYDLAYEYRLWRQSPLYRKPIQENLPVLVAMFEDCPELRDKLFRFYTYRRLFCRKPAQEKVVENHLAKDMQKMQKTIELQKIKNATLLTAHLTAEMSLEETKKKERREKKETDTNSKAKEGTVLEAPRTIRSTGSISETQQVRIPSPPTNDVEDRSETAPDTVPFQENGPRPAPAKHVKMDNKAEKKLSTAEKVAAVTGILVEHQRDPRNGGKGKRPAGPPLPEYLARKLTLICELFHDAKPASSRTDLARLYLRARVASGERMTPEEFYDEYMAKPRKLVENMLENGEISTKHEDNPDIPNGMPLFLKKIRLSVEKAEKQAQKQRVQDEQIAYLAQRYRQSQGAQVVQENAPAPSPASSSEQCEPEQPEVLQPSDAGQPEQPEVLQPSDAGQPEQPEVLQPSDAGQSMMSDAEDSEAKLQADLHHLNPAVRRSAARRLYARKQLPRLEALGVPTPIEQLHHCFCSFGYAPATPGAEPRCVSCDADPSWPAEVVEIVEAVKQYRGE